MSQSSFIAAMLLAGFALFLAARGRLPTYAAVLWGPPPAPPSSSSGGAGGGTASTVKTAVDAAEIASEVLA
jgi:hypothetical protein